MSIIRSYTVAIEPIESETTEGRGKRGGEGEERRGEERVGEAGYTYQCSYHSLYAEIVAKGLNDKEFNWLAKQIIKIMKREAKWVSFFATDEGEIGEILMNIQSRLKDKVMVKGGILCK
ncbi:MAG: hypothetical protein QXI43_00135 [Candidatus Nitrosocaldus sp.]